MTEKNTHQAYPCPCEECQQDATSESAQLHASIKQMVAALDEKNRRWFVGLWAKQLGRGGIQRLARITGLDRKTIRRGRCEIEAASSVLDDRVRAPGGGRQPVEKKSPNC